MLNISALAQSKAIRQFIKYVIVGCIVTGIDLVALHLSFRILNIPIKLSVIIGFMCGNVPQGLYAQEAGIRSKSSP